MSAAAATMSGCSRTQTPQALIDEARSYQEKGNTKAAIIQLKNALQKNPNQADARFLLGTIYLDAGDALSAEKEFDKAISAGMARDKVAPSLAQAYLQAGKNQQALDAMPLPANGPATAETLTLRGNALLAQGKTAEAETSFQQALKVKPDSLEALLGLAQHAVVTKNPISAMRFADRAVAEHPNDFRALMVKGEQLRINGKSDEALAIYDRALKVKPNAPDALTAKATIEIGYRKFDQAKSNIDAARKLAPNALTVFYTQALLDFTEGKNVAALDSLRQILRVAPDNLSTLLLAGAVQAATGENEQAEKHLRRYLELNPANLYATKLLASVLTKSGQTDQAMQVLAPAIKTNNPDPQILLLAGQNAMRVKDYAKANEYFEQANKIAPQSPIVHTALAVNNLGQGENSKAIAETELAANLNGTDASASGDSVALAMTQMRLSKFAEALALLRTLEKQQPKNALIFNLEGGAYIGLKDFTNGRASFLKALSLQPNYMPAVQNLAQLDLQEKKPEDAKKRFMTVLDTDKKNTEAMTALAAIAMATGKPEEATSWLERANSQNPAAVKPAIQLGSHYLKIGQKEKALTLAQKLQAANLTNPEVLDLLAQAQFANGDKTAALTTYNKVLLAAPKSALAQSRMAKLQIALGDSKAAMESLKKAIALQPAYLEAQLALAALEARGGDTNGAIDLAHQIQKQHSKEAIGFSLEGDLLASQKKFMPAVLAYEKAVSLAKSSDLIVKLHQTMTAAGKGKDADAHLAKWIQDNPDELAAQAYQGQLYIARKQNKLAISTFEHLVEKVPTNPIALNNLAYLYQLEKDAKALPTAEKAVQFGPQLPSTLDTLGWILVEKGNTGRGLPLLQKAADLAEKSSAGGVDSQNIRYHLASAMLKSGDKAGARKELEQLVASGKTFSELENAKALLKTL
jgi:putative PEP-CTERM system TPR-repeat lipoprotein